MAIRDEKTVSFKRFQCNIYAHKDKWKSLEKGRISTRANTGKGIARAVMAALIHFNEETDMVLFTGTYYQDRNKHFCGICCPKAKVVEIFDYEEGRKLPREYQDAIISCKHYIENQEWKRKQMKNWGYFSTESDIYEYELMPSFEDKNKVVIGYFKSGLSTMYVVDGLHSAVDLENFDYIKKQILEQEKKNGK